MNALRERLAASLADRYDVDGEVGRGAMATVFRAADLRHDRPVAIKVLHPDLSSGLAADLFLREIRTAARLQHPHIVPLYDSGEADGLLYYVMPLVAGESLRRRIEKDGPLSLEDAIRIAAQVADALGHAHRGGIVHRDIKPENILLAEDNAWVADFGIATAIRSAETRTPAGPVLVVGTPAYMAPEQTESDDVDHRADLYSLGCVLYEMLAGRRPWDGPTPVAIIARRMMGDIVPLRDLRPDLPSGVEAVIARALAAEPASRHDSAAGFARELRLAPSRTDDVGHVRPGPRRPSVAVLPFTSMSDDPANEYFSDGMAEELTAALTKLAELKVAARSSAFAFRGRDVDVREVGQALGVGTVLQGSVRRAGDRLRVTAQLVDVRDGMHLWSERYDRRMTDVFRIQDEIAAAIVEQFRIRLTPEQQARPLVRRGTDDLAAYHLYLQGRYFWERRALPRALETFEQAVRKDPGYALPLAGLADGYSLLAYYGFLPSAGTRDRATDAASRATAADPRLAEAWIAAAGVAWFFEYDVTAAEAAFRRAVTLDPGSSYAHAAITYFYGVLGRGDDMLAHGRRALELDVMSPHAARLVGLAHALAGRFDAGVELCRSAVELDPNSAVAAFGLGFALTRRGRYDEAIEALDRALRLAPPSPLYLMALGYAQALAGLEEQAAAMVRRLREQSLEPWCAWVLAALGDLDGAFRALRVLFEQRNPLGIYFAHWPGWSGLRADPRFAEVVRATGLERLAP